MSTEAKEPNPNGAKTEQISRRAVLIKLAAVSIGAIVAVDLANRKILVPPKEEEEKQKQISALRAKLYEEASSLYPSVPDLTPDNPVITAKNSLGQQVTLTYYEGDKLIEASGYSQAELDQRRYFDGAKDKNEMPTPTKADGSYWSLRERILIRPDIYNRERTRTFNEELRLARQHFVATRIPLPDQPQAWDLRDHLELWTSELVALGILAKGIIRFSRSLINHKFDNTFIHSDDTYTTGFRRQTVDSDNPDYTDTSTLKQENDRLREEIARLRTSSNVRSPFEVLGVPVNATSDQIREAWLRLQKSFHPDAAMASDKKTGIDSSSPEYQHRLRLFEQRTQEINQAYEALKKSGRAN